MKDPNQFRLFLPEVGKEHFQITVMTVKVVQQHHTGRKPFQFRNDSFGFRMGIKTIVSHNPRFECLNFGVSRLTAGDTQAIAICGGTEKDIVFNSPVRQQFTDGYRNFSCTSHTAGGVDLDNFRRRRIYPS